MGIGQTIDAVSLHSQEITAGERFEFGKNWSKFLELLNENRIKDAENSLLKMLETDTLQGKTFLDIGSGSGLFSLAARRLGAKVHSFDYDPFSVACTRELRHRFFPKDANWRVEEGSALDAEYLETLGKFDVVYSWGVLHHTGKMWDALENAHQRVAANGQLFIAIYNDTGTQAKRWLWKKKIYNRLPGFLRVPFMLAAIAPEEAKAIVRSLLKLNPMIYVRTWTTNYESGRGMNKWRDVVDWVGGYPYEVATPDEIFEFYKARGFTLTKLKCGGVGLGCNEFVFQKTHEV